MTIYAKNAGRIVVWPNSGIALQADTEESKVFRRMTVWNTISEAQEHLSFEPPSEGGGGGPAWYEAYESATVGLPLVALELKDGNFYWSGSEQVVGDLDDVLGASFGSLTANGLEVLSTNANRPAAAGALLTAINTAGGCTILVQAKGDALIAEEGANPTVIQAVFAGYTNELGLTYDVVSGRVALFDYNSATMRRDVATLSPGGVTKTVCTIKSNAYALAANGSAVLEDVNGLQQVWDVVRFGWYDGDSQHVESYYEKIIVWAALPASEVEDFAAL